MAGIIEKTESRKEERRRKKGREQMIEEGQTETKKEGTKGGEQRTELRLTEVNSRLWGAGRTAEHAAQTECSTQTLSRVSSMDRKASRPDGKWFRPLCFSASIEARHGRCIQSESTARH